MKYFYSNTEVPLETVEEGKTTREIKAYGDEIMMVEVFFENEAIGHEHVHIHAQTTYCLEGSFEFNVGGEIKVISIGDTVYMPPNIIHGCKLLTDKGRLLDVFAPLREDFLKK